MVGALILNAQISITGRKTLFYKFTHVTEFWLGINVTGLAKTAQGVLYTLYI